MSAPIKHYLQFADFTAEEYAYLLQRAALIKRKFKAYEKHHTRAACSVASDWRQACQAAVIGRASVPA